MPIALSERLRSAIWLLHQQGQPADAIAVELRLDVRTVYRLLARFRSADGPCSAAYHHCGRVPCAADEVFRQRVLELRRLHPGWGAGRILTELAKSHSQALPGRSTVKRWLAQARLAAKPYRPARLPPPRAGRAHQIWQMDACEMIPLGNGTRVCWLRLIDEASGAVLLTRVFPQESWAAVGKHAVQAVLREAFSRWGMPEVIRVDRGIPWFSKEGLPSDLELWLAGLAVPLHLIRARRPQDNGVVERSMGTGKRWADPLLCHSYQQLQRRIDEEDQVQRELYRDEGGLTRRQRYPGLLNSGRGYALPWEKVCWDLAGALARLAECRLTRKANKQGQVSLYDRHHRVGKGYGEAVVEVRFDAASVEWCFLVGEAEVGRSPACQITQARIVGLELGSRQGRSARATAAKKAVSQPDNRP
jgi:transposase InsO family protein